jgi:hypothetical protein
MRARVVASAGLMGLVAALWLTSAAAAETTTLGAATPPGPVGAGVADFAVIQVATDPATPSYVVPPVPAGGGPWSVTSWGARGGNGDGSAAIEIWRPTGTAGEFRLVAIGPQQPFPTGVVTTHSVNIPVLPGDHLGVVSGTDSDFRSNYVSGLSGDVAIWSLPPNNPALGQTMGADSSDISPHGGGTQNRANVQATLTSTPAVATPPPNANTKKKCKKKKKHKRSAESAKKKKCKKRKKH